MSYTPKFQADNSDPIISTLYPDYDVYITSIVTPRNSDIPYYILELTRESSYGHDSRIITKFVKCDKFDATVFDEDVIELNRNVQELSEELSALSIGYSELQNQYNELKDNISKLKPEYETLLKYADRYPEFKLILDYINGTRLYFVVRDSWEVYSKILTEEEIVSEYGGVRLITLYGKDESLDKFSSYERQTQATLKNRPLNYMINRYSDGSGGNSNIKIFDSYDSALKWSIEEDMERLKMKTRDRETQEPVLWTELVNVVSVLLERIKNVPEYSDYKREIEDILVEQSKLYTKTMDVRLQEAKDNIDTATTKMSEKFKECYSLLVS